MQSAKWKTIVLEDQLLFRDLLVRLLREEDRFTLCGATDSSRQAIELCRQYQPDLLLLDIQLPEGDGVDLGRQILKDFPKVRILAVTTLTDPGTINRILDAGIHGYIEKDMELPLFCQAMVRVASGGHFQSELARKALQESRKDPDSFTKILSPREQEIVRLVAKGLTSKQISDRLDISPRTVENHRHHIMKRLGLASSAEMIRYAYDKGIARPT